MSPTGLHYHMDYSSLLSLPICKLPFLQWKTWLPSFSIHFLNCSILVNIYKVSELLIHPRGIILAVRVCTYVQFLFTIKLDSTCFQSYIDQLLFLWLFFFFFFNLDTENHSVLSMILMNRLYLVYTTVLYKSFPILKKIPHVLCTLLLTSS